MRSQRRQRAQCKVERLCGGLCAVVGENSARAPPPWFFRILSNAMASDMYETCRRNNDTRRFLFFSAVYNRRHKLNVYCRAFKKKQMHDQRANTPRRTRASCA